MSVAREHDDVYLKMEISGKSENEIKVRAEDRTTRQQPWLHNCFHSAALEKEKKKRKKITTESN